MIPYWVFNTLCIIKIFYSSFGNISYSDSCAIWACSSAPFCVSFPELNHFPTLMHWLLDKWRLQRNCLHFSRTFWANLASPGLCSLPWTFQHLCPLLRQTLGYPWFSPFYAVTHKLSLGSLGRVYKWQHRKGSSYYYPNLSGV